MVLARQMMAPGSQKPMERRLARMVVTIVLVKG